MIQLPTERYIDFIEFLNDMKLTIYPCWLVVVPTYSTVGDEDGDLVGFAVYLPEEKTIFVGGNTDEIAELIKQDTGVELINDELEEIIYHHIAHEYFHHLQNINSEEFNEKEAENFAHKVVNEFLNRS
jgi:hypothetical protein